MDMAIQKAFKVFGEGKELTLRTEVFNLFDRANYYNPNSIISLDGFNLNPEFGQVKSAHDHAKSSSQCGLFLISSCFPKGPHTEGFLLHKVVSCKLQLCPVHQVSRRLFLHPLESSFRPSAKRTFGEYPREWRARVMSATQWRISPTRY